MRKIENLKKESNCFPYPRPSPLPFCMDYISVYFKEIHCDGLDKISNTPEYTGEIHLTPEPIEPSNGRLPIIFLWKYRISKGGILVSSYVAENKYLLQFDINNRHPSKEICELIDHSHMIFANEWGIKIDGMRIEGRQVPMISIKDKIATAREIIDLAKRLSLL
jgi:hypothetical protein